jgi:hypothetical protein
MGRCPKLLHEAAKKRETTGRHFPSSSFHYQRATAISLLKKRHTQKPLVLALTEFAFSQILVPQSLKQDRERECTQEDTTRSTSWRSGARKRKQEIHSLIRNPCYGNPKIRIFEKELKWMRNFKPLCNRLSLVQSRVWRIWLVDRSSQAVLGDS